MKTKLYQFFLVSVCLTVLGACGGLKVNIGGGTENPLKEYVLEGKEEEKILIIPIRGFISDLPRRHLLGEGPGMVQEIVSRLKKAEKDDKVRALVLEINSAGGSTTAADMIYHEIMRFKERKNIKIVAIFMDLAASGGYYAALPADRIVAHPTGIVGSIGVVIITPKVAGLMDKLGIAVDVSKSGSEKDMGSPFRPSTVQEHRIFQELTDRMARRFIDLVVKHRKLNESQLKDISSARIYLADDAMKLNLVDRIGHIEDAISEAKLLNGLSEKARVIVYRRTKYPDDTLYNTSLTHQQEPLKVLRGSTLPSVSDMMPVLGPGFYYLWLPGVFNN